MTRRAACCSFSPPSSLPTRVRTEEGRTAVSAVAYATPHGERTYTLGKEREREGEVLYGSLVAMDAVCAGGNPNRERIVCFQKHRRQSGLWATSRSPYLCCCYSRLETVEWL